jgi:minimal PKS acyl carrier protein
MYLPALPAICLGAAQASAHRRQETDMPPTDFTTSTLMDLLVRKVGLPKAMCTDDPNVTLAELGLDSLAVIQLQAEISDEYGVELDDVPGHALTTGQVVAAVTGRAYEGSVS